MGTRERAKASWQLAAHNCERDLASLAGEGSIFGGSAAEKLERLQAELEPLSCRYDVVVANPPYMGSSNMNGWVSKWVKKNYPVAKSDLCTCFFSRAQRLAKDDGYISMITASSWMFISSFEKFRKQLLAEGSICSMIQQSTHGYAGVTVPTTMFTYACHRMGVIGSYIRLEDFDRPQWQEPRALEALADPDCGWFYRADADGFGAIPGSPIAYWASEAMVDAFSSCRQLGDLAEPKQGMVTRDNARFMRMWWEVTYSRMTTDLTSHENAKKDKSYKWVPCTSGGAYRKWYGNNESVMNWANDGEELIAFSGAHIKNRGYYFRESITWTAISSSVLSMRYVPTGFVPEHAGNCLYGSSSALKLLQGICNSSFCIVVMSLLSPTLNFNVGDLVKVPVKEEDGHTVEITSLVDSCRFLSKEEWDNFEVSWGFSHHPLV